MHIAFVVSYLDERYGGPVTTAKNLGRVLSRMGHHVSCWATVARWESDYSCWFDDVHRYDIQWPFGWRRSKEFGRGLSQAIRSVDIVHISEFWLYPVLAASGIAYAHGVPYVLRPAGSLDPWNLRHGAWKRIKKRLYLEMIGRKMMQRAACLHATSPQEADSLRRLGYDDPVCVIPNGVDVAEFAEGDASEAETEWPHLKDRPVVLFLSRLNPKKGLDVLIPAWADVVRSGACKEAVLVVAGPDEGGYGRVVQALIERHDVGSHVCMTGIVTGRRKATLLKRADIFILPSHSENFGIVVAEALACGTPVITTTGTPWTQLEQVDAGRCVPARPAELAGAIRELLGMSASRRQAMGQRGLEFVQAKLTWQSVAGRYLALYDCILQGKPVPFPPESQQGAF